MLQLWSLLHWSDLITSIHVLILTIVTYTTVLQFLKYIQKLQLVPKEVARMLTNVRTRIAGYLPQFKVLLLAIDVLHMSIYLSHYKTVQLIQQERPLWRFFTARSSVMWSTVKDLLFCGSQPNGEFDSHSPSALKNGKTRFFPHQVFTGREWYRFFWGIYNHNSKANRLFMTSLQCFFLKKKLLDTVKNWVLGGGWDR